MSIQADLLIPQGADWTGPSWALLDPDGAGIDETGWTLKAQVRAKNDAPDVLHEWSEVDVDYTVRTVTVYVNDVNGVGIPVETVAVALTVANDVSSAWNWRVGVYDVEVTLDDKVYKIVSESKVRVLAEVTR